MSVQRPEILPSWADAGDKVKPTDAEIAIGWPSSPIPPSRQRFNWILNYLANAVRYLTKRGIPDWNINETYDLYDTVTGPDGSIYRSAVSGNQGNIPSTSYQWAMWSTSPTSYLAVTLKALCDSNRVLLKTYYL